MNKFPLLLSGREKFGLKQVSIYIRERLSDIIQAVTLKDVN